MSAQQTNLGIVVGVDGSPCSHTAVEWAARDAQMRNVALRVVQVVPPVITAPEGWAFEYSRFQEAQKREIVEHSYLVAQAHQIVEQAHKVALEASSSGRAAQITGEVLHGQIVPTLANISRQVAMVVLGYRGQGAVAGALLGSVSSSLVRHAHGPVAVIPEEPRPARPPHAPVVVGIDGSPTSGLAAEIAFDEASRRGVDLVALHAWSDMGPLDFPRLNWAPIEWRNLEDEQEKMLARRLSADGKTGIPMSSCTKSWCAIDRHPACSNWHKPLSLWWLAATAAGGSPACISAQSAERWSIPVRLRLSSPESPKIRQCRPEGLCDLLGWCPPARKAPSEP